MQEEPDFPNRVSELVSYLYHVRSDVILNLGSLGAVQLNSSLLIVSVIAILLPTAFHFTAGDQIDDPKEGRDILAVSHGVCFMPTNQAD